MLSPNHLSPNLCNCRSWALMATTASTTGAMSASFPPLRCPPVKWLSPHRKLSTARLCPNREPSYTRNSFQVDAPRSQGLSVSRLRVFSSYRTNCCHLQMQVLRRNVLSSLLTATIFPQLGFSGVSIAEPSNEFRAYIDIFDGYSLMYPKNWIQVRGAGADIFFRDPFVLDENFSIELSSPSSSRYKSVEDLGPPEAAAEKVMKQYLTEFMSTRLGVRRESSILSTSSRVADDGKLYYQIEVNIKSYANNNELAVMPQDRIARLEWDRRYLSVLGVGNNRLYELRLQTPENVFVDEEKILRQVMDSFRVINSVD